MITVKIQGADASEVQLHILQLANLFGQPVSPVRHIEQTAPVIEKPAPAVNINSEKTSAPTPTINAPSSEGKKGRGRPVKKENVVVPAETKAAITTIQPPPVTEAAPSTEATPQVSQIPSGPTKEQAVAALKEVTDKYGAERGVLMAREILGKYKASRISEVAPEQYDDFIKHCKASLITGIA